ncbi:T9SS type A sorting domain-containing protein [Ilyomonas limi]|uniref:T9SS type A sorting domain-containing protein n=1 Tax=Ilyomonas limi TaxID=2575867 RepID=A0A4U3KZT6_9BACT|nr:T9SS type A sorting domain-containing protein [Ilyomonas limi]TKK67992.1 T9SS type A sorting domain-containing protein [Ilyomonas limi]
MKLYQMYQGNNYQVAKICTPVLMLAMAAFSNPVTAQQKKTFFVNEQANPLKSYAVPSNRESHPFFIDIDGDGDLDCFSGEYTNSQVSKIYYYRNDGTNRKPVFKPVSGQFNPLSKVEANTLSIPYFVDIDGDGDYDCFIGEGTTGAVMYYKNTGSATHPNFQKQSAAFNPLSMVKFSTSDVANPAFADIDADGDYDCLIADEAGYLNYFKNTGTVDKPVFEHMEDRDNPFESLSSQGGIYNVSFEDWNKDGLIDLFINTAYYRNIGTKVRPQFSSGSDDKPVFQDVSAYKYTYNPLRWVDLNDDGVKEVVQGSAKGGFVYQTFTANKGKVAHIASNVAVHVSPNPSSNEFTLSISPAAPSIIRVIDVQGKLLSTQITGSSTVKFGTELKPGVYILQIMQNNEVIYNQKIIKE